ncbi:hypothetical protein MMC17_005524 [Xylographa soralifera]|nr:hypothetical protein [Xylographa soralifera]
MVFLGNFTWYFLELPIVRLFEYAVCQQYYRSHPELINLSQGTIEERLCKTKLIQSKVAYLTGGRISLEALSGMLTVLFYALVADKHGRKIVLIMGYTGELLVIGWVVCVCYYNDKFPVMIAWLSALILMIGGGLPVVNSVLFTMLTDVTQPAQRIQLMYILHTLSLLSGVIAPPLAALSMSSNLWLSFGVASILYVVQLIFAFAAPETKDFAKAHPRTETSSPSAEANETHDSTSTLDVREREPQSSSSNSIRARVYRVVSEPQILLCLHIFFLKRAGFQSQPFVYQYASEKFGLKLEQTPWVRSALSISSVLVVGIVLPLATWYLHAAGFRSRSIGLGVIRGSLMLLTVSFSGVWAAARIIPFGLGKPPLWLPDNQADLNEANILCGFGEGLEPALQGYAASIIDAAQNAQLFTTIAFVETLARITFAPTMAKLYSEGRDANEIPNGAPFLVSAVSQN